MKKVVININIAPANFCPESVNLHECAAIKFLATQKDVVQNTGKSEAFYFDLLNYNYKVLDEKKFSLVFAAVRETCRECHEKHKQKTK